MTSEPMEPRSTAELAYGKEATGDGDGDMGSRQRPGADAAEHMPLMSEDKSRGYSNRWQEVQAEFVDEPQKAVRDADGLVAEVIQSLATTFADQRKGLEDQWSKGSEVSTEDLRQALMQYRSFFQRLLAA